jgi:hypothetical protein
MRFTSCNSALDLLTVGWVMLSKPVDPKISKNVFVGEATKIAPKKISDLINICKITFERIQFEHQIF